MSEKNNVASRYCAAWGEHSVRVAQRQSVLQSYLTLVPAIFGYYYLTNEAHPGFLLFGVTFVTLISSWLFWTHTRVLQRLTLFMAKCEYACIQEINISGGGYYFLDVEATQKKPLVQIASFHGIQRMIQRWVFVLLAITSQGGAEYAALVAFKGNPTPEFWISTASCSLVTLGSIFLPFYLMRNDKTDADLASKDAGSRASEASIQTG